ncbi:MAG: GntR family transcriptional regulator [candidate division KSB1 bacterium]|nr:GntR family transcriptional regulator [candidate division KSB1 bacterium]MDQ7065706.1 GntR family transcriptional regulator [candidate division KSB1 bacterium]
MNVTLSKHSRPSLKEQAYERIEEMIVTLELPPGTLLSEYELSRQIGIGRTPVREALQRLAAERLVTPLPRRGIVVAEINLTDMLAILETRRALDRLLASRAAERGSDAERQALRACAVDMQKAAASGDLRGFMREDRRFDRIAGEASRNRFAAEASAPLHTHCRRFWFRYRDNGDLQQSAARHIAVMQAIAAGDAEKAGDATERLIDYLETFTRSTIDVY